jgi:hypothetical protein
MSNWLGTWDVEQKTMVGVLPMTMVVTAAGNGYDVVFEGDRVAATALDVHVDGDALTINTDLRKPMKAKAIMELRLTSADTFDGAGKIRFLPNSSFAGSRRTS